MSDDKIPDTKEMLMTVIYMVVDHMQRVKRLKQRLAEAFGETAPVSSPPEVEKGTPVLRGAGEPAKG